MADQKVDLRGKPTFRWKEALIGGFVTLFVTIAAGVALWLITREPQQTERLTFKASPEASFSSQGRSLSFANIEVGNVGTALATNIVIAIPLNGGQTIVGKVVRSPLDIAAQPIDRSDARKVAVLIPRLMPKDHIILSYAYRGSTTSVATAEVRSDRTIATREKPNSENNNVIDLSVFQLLSILGGIIITQIALQQLVAYVRFRKERNGIGLSTEYYPTRNNVGFLALHSGNTALAIRLFEADIDAGNSDLITFANASSAYKILGDTLKSQEMMAMARWPTRDRVTTSFLNFNEAIIDAIDKDHVSATSKLSLSLKECQEIDHYCRNSNLIKELFPDLPELLNS